MQLKKLQPTFYTNNSHLQEALDNINGSWVKGKTRGYGIVVVQINSLTFAIPLRSNIPHKAAYITARSFNSPSKGKGLDFSKALLINPTSDLSTEVFKIPKDEHNRLVNKEHFITAKFDKYVQEYIAAVAKGDQNILNSAEYRYSTLTNYHKELGITG